jgi:hypothetical protein
VFKREDFLTKKEIENLHSEIQSETEPQYEVQPQNNEQGHLPF